MKKVLKIVAVVLYFIGFGYAFTSLSLSLFYWIKDGFEYSFINYAKGYFIRVWQQLPEMREHDMLSWWINEYVPVIILSLFVALSVLLIIKHKWVIKQVRKFNNWIKNKKENSKSNRIKRLEEELEQLKKGD